MATHFEKGSYVAYKTVFVKFGKFGKFLDAVGKKLNCHVM